MLKSEFSFELITQNDKARVGLIKTSRGNINTPALRLGPGSGGESHTTQNLRPP